MSKSADRQPVKKLRGIARRLRALEKWGLSVSEQFPSQKELAENRLYWNWKIPTDWALVEGPYSTPEIKRTVAQLLIDTCARLAKVKPAWAAACHVTACICLPDMHASEICIYLDEAYFMSKLTADGSDGQCHIAGIEGRRLSEEWQLRLPDRVEENGSLWHADGDADGWGAYSSQHWMYGEVGT
ncbi:DUF3916 domain-containing protein [Undibacterium sp. TJN19]|uniref:DUF3916 domain-containing protein n=1 Tax=Undibacterium sp. TJN19 TaxID=3413055 RepID=UPI003BF3170A